MKKITFCVAILMSAASLFAQAATFTGEAGVMGNIALEEYERTVEGVKENVTSPAYVTGAYLDAQLDFNNVFFLRSEFSVQTQKSYMDSSLVITDLNSKFRLNEFSGTLRLGQSVSNDITLFYGSHEFFGSDIFIQRHLGISPITSDLTRTRFGINTYRGSLPICAGLSYIIDPKSPVSFGTSLYANYNKSTVDVGGTPTTVLKPELNGDLRFAAAFQRLEIDSTLGASFVTSKKFDALEGVTLNGGLHMLLGNPYGSSIYLQADIKDYNVLAPALPALNTMDAIVELRYASALNQLTLSLYGFGKDYVANSDILQNISYSDILIGGAITFQTRDFYVNEYCINAGFNVNYSFMDPDFTNLFSDISGTITSWNCAFLVTPYFDFSFTTGKLYGAIQVDVWKVMADPAKAIRGYTAVSFYF